MKHPFRYLLFFSSFISGSLFAQEYKNTAKEQFLHYTHLVIEKDFRAAAEFVMDEFFTIIPKEQMITAMEAIFNIPDLNYTIDSPQVLQVGDSTIAGASCFLKLKYANILRMKFDTGQDSARADTSLAENELLTLTLQSKFGEKNVKYNQHTGFYDIYSVKDVIARSDDLKEWKFIVMEEDKLPFLKKILPKELLE
ncbi:hypothetical protein [Niabella aquatica]